MLNRLKLAIAASLGNFRDNDTLAIDPPEDRKPNHKTTTPSFNAAQMTLLSIGGTAAGQAFGLNRTR